jgi:hypothetical protein
MGSGPRKFSNTVVEVTKRFRKAIFAIFGVGTALDLFREFFRGKIMDWLASHLGLFGIWLAANPISFVAIGATTVIALIIIAFIHEEIRPSSSTIVDINDRPFARKKRSKWLTGVVIGGLLSIGIVWYSAKKFMTIKKLQALQQTAPSFPDFGEDAETAVVSFGNNQASFDLSVLRGQKSVQAVKFTDDSGISIRLNNENLLLVSCMIWSPIGMLPIGIIDNKFYGTLPLGWDKNYSPDAFEIVDNKGNPALQIIRNQPNQIVIRGVFPGCYGKNYVGDAFTATKFEGPPPKEFSISHIFKYPAWRHKGEYLNNLSESSLGIPGFILRNAFLDLNGCSKDKNNATPPQ